jgi:hypothetical protein
VQTVPHTGGNTILRLYGPLEPWFARPDGPVTSSPSRTTAGKSLTDKVPGRVAKISNCRKQAEALFARPRPEAALRQGVREMMSCFAPMSTSATVFCRRVPADLGLASAPGMSEQVRLWRED